jgi:prepilin-type N-terminal cleavage/methylation domain-containing protein
MRTARRRARGFTMIEMLVALALAAIMIAGLAGMVNASLGDMRAQQAALYQSQLTTAAAQLVRQNYTALASAATVSKPVVVKLTGAPYALSSWLPAGTGALNAYRQTPCLLVYAGAVAGTLQALLVTEGGTTVADSELGYIAANAGAGGGSIPSLNNAGGAALGAYGSWKVAAPNPAGASCSGTKTGPGHLASLVTYNATQAQNADYLYRVAVPGDPSANAMQVPIVLAPQTAYAGCSTLGAVAADTLGEVLNCEGNVWVPQASFHWRGTVADAQALTTLPSPVTGDVAMTLATNRAYTFNGSTWQALAVDESGNLNLGNTQTIGSACAPDAASTTPVTTNAAGQVLSCQNGIWQTQSEIEPALSTTRCTMIMTSPGATDYSNCAAPPSTDYYASPFSYDSTNGTFSYQVSTPVILTKPGVIVATSWAHLNDSSCKNASSSNPAQAQISQTVDIYDSASHDLGHTESQGPTLSNDSGGINNTLTQAGAPGTYSVVVTTNWATYNVINTPWTSSYCGASNQTVPNTPVAAGWSINSYY